MTPDHLRDTIATAVRLSVRSGMQHRRRADMARLQLTCIEFAAMAVNPAIEALIEETTETALAVACQPWEPGTQAGPPSPASPLWHVWVGGAVAAIDAMAEQLGVQLNDPMPLGDDTAELVAAEVRAVLAEARRLALMAQKLQAHAVAGTPITP